MTQGFALDPARCRSRPGARAARAPGLHVYVLHPGEPADELMLPGHAALLPPEERARYERFRFPHKKNEFLLGKLLTRWVLSRHHPRPPAAWTFTVQARGKPDPHDAPGLRFNLSHTRGLLAVAVIRDHDVGIDVEQVARRDSAVADRFFAPEEAAQVRAAPPAERDRLFARFWTLKEAYIKTLGDGLSIPLASFRFMLGNPVRIAFRDPGTDDPDCWWFAHRDPTPAHALAVAVRVREPVEAHWHTLALEDLLASS